MTQKSNSPLKVVKTMLAKFDSSLIKGATTANDRVKKELTKHKNLVVKAKSDIKKAKDALKASSKTNKSSKVATVKKATITLKHSEKKLDELQQIVTLLNLVSAKYRDIAKLAKKSVTIINKKKTSAKTVKKPTKVVSKKRKRVAKIATPKKPEQAAA